MEAASLEQTGSHYIAIGFGQSSGEVTSAGPPSLPKPRKPHRRLTPAQKEVMLEKRRKAIPEVLGPLVDTPEGRKVYENHDIALQDGTYTCLTCGFATGAQYKENWKKLQLIKVHVRAKHLNAYRCHLCEKNFTTHKCHRQHLQKMHPPEITVLRLCDLCGKSVSNLDAHLWHHKTPEAQREVIQSGKGFAILTCDKCGKEFEGFDKLAAHQTIGYRCQRRKELEYPLDSVTEKGSNRKLPCLTCGKLVFLSNLAQHEWTHKNDAEKEDILRLGTAPMVPCPICNKFLVHTSFKRHLERHKKPEERACFRCEWDGCTRQFSQEEFLVRHTKIDHEGLPVPISRRDRKRGDAVSFKCPDPSCSSRFFTYQANLDDHIARRRKFTVRAERPIKCDICQARFLIRNDLNKHLRNHRPREDFTLTCPHCPMLFACPHILRRHLTAEHAVPRVTRAERCRRYRERRKTQENQDARPFTCDICHLGFRLKGGLTKHLKNHGPRGDFTLTCPHCPALFATSKPRRWHLTTEHGVPKESNAARQKRYHALRKQAREKRVSNGDEVSRPLPGRKTRARSKRINIDSCPDDDVGIKEEDGVIRDVLSSDGDDDDDPVPAINYGTDVEIKSQDEESNGDLDNDAYFSPLSDEIKSEHEGNSDVDTESEHTGFKMLTFEGYSSSEDSLDEDPLKLETDDLENLAEGTECTSRSHPCAQLQRP